MRGNRTVVDFGGVAIGTATDAGELYDFGGIRCGRVSAQGEAYDHAGVHIGLCRTREDEATRPSAAGASDA